MYEIVNSINSDYAGEGINEFAQFLSLKTDRTCIWAAVQMLEKMEINDNIKNRALAIIEEEAKQSYGMKLWLKEYINKNI